ncbi:PR domain zinc finger protein 5 [Orussus abietinus]|uniref:PR domain zinc finger protein 5 n=1 Tax=Orussus abietinus TaxID=222816 RepID=UPI00062526A3|nr:PR domain zinc finger protein 5 [Orussus abietinus]
MAAMNNWGNSCRLCSEEKTEMLPIFGDEGLQRKVAQKLRACLPVMVYKTDPLPKQICQFCAARLDDAYEFREYCLSVYKSMYIKLLAMKDLEAVHIFLDAMKNSPDPCQVQLCSEKARAPPPLVPLPTSLPFECPSIPVSNPQTNPVNNGGDPLPELPCEVQIEEPLFVDLGSNSHLKEKSVDPQKPNNNDVMVIETPENDVVLLDDRLDERKSPEIEVKKEEKRTSILEQVLTGNLTLNDRKELTVRSRLSSKWWCPPCNNYYRTKESLMKHLNSCPRVYTCKKCSLVFASVEELAKHEGSDHLKITLDFDETVKECHQCEREFVSWDMLRHHRLRDHVAESIEIGRSTWCPLCNRFFPSIDCFESHKQLHQQAVCHVALPSLSIESVPQKEEIPKVIKKEHENVKSLTCPTCGKVCTQQSALSNHMRTHEPKKHKCDICGRSFGLFIRLAAHRLSEHNQQPIMTPVMASVEQEEALNEEREAREAREARTRGRTRTYSEMADEDVISIDDQPPIKRNPFSNANASKNVARCGICLKWFGDHTTMLTHLQTHSDNYVYKNFSCRVCKKTFKEKWQLLRHEVIHKRGNMSLYTCNICNKSFTDKDMHKAHQATHTVDKTYHCPKCNKIFFKEFSLMTHQCTGKSLFSKKNATLNTIQKSGNYGASKKYKCSTCNAAFATSQSRNSHMKMHTENQKTMQLRNQEVKKEKDFESMPKLTPETSAGTSVPFIEPKVEIKEEAAPIPVKRTLIRTAGGYRCGVCQSPFVLRELAVAHLRSAHPVMPYQCPYCKKRFTTQYMFTHHIKTDHPDE